MSAPRPTRSRHSLDLERQPALLPPPAIKVQKQIQNQESKRLLESPTGGWISGALHFAALTSFAIASGYASEYLLMIGFWTGVWMGLMIYGTMALILWRAETD